MNQNNQLQIKENDKLYILILAGGLGARIVQTSFIRSMIKMRKRDKTSFPIVVIDNSIIGMMVSNALQGQNIHGIQVPDSPHALPHDPGLIPTPSGMKEVPMFLDFWRLQNLQYTDQSQGSFHKLIKSNIERTYQIEYGFNLNKLIMKHRYNKDRKSFIANLYSKSMTDSLPYDGGTPMLKRTETNKDLENYLNGSGKPIVLLHVGVDRNSQDFAQGINYRTFKAWSIHRWAEVVQKLKHKYQFVQVYANQWNVEIPDVMSIKVDSLNPVLQILEHPKTKFFMSIDNYLPHLAANNKKRGIVLWGSCSPNVWGWTHNINIWNENSCPFNDIACWRPGMFDTNNEGRTWVCPEYKCMTSITVDQVLRSIQKLERQLDKDTTQDKVVL